MPNINQLTGFIKALSQTKRLALITFILLTILLLMRWKPILLSFAVLVSISVGLLLRGRKLIHQLKFPILRRLSRGIFLLRGLLRYPPGVELLHIATLLLIILSVIYLISTQDLRGTNFFGTAAVLTLLGSVVIDAGRQIVYLAKKAWARTLGKVGLAATGAVLYYIADAISKDIIHWITHSDPKYFPDATGLLISAISPILYLAIGSLLAFVWALVQLIALGTILFIGQSMGMWKLSSHAWDRMIYRIRTGHKAPAGYTAPLLGHDGFLFLMRPIGLLIAVGYFWSSMGTLTTAYSDQINQYTQDIVVATEYRGNALCHGLSQEAKIVYLNNGLISVVETNSGKRKFYIRQCGLD